MKKLFLLFISITLFSSCQFKEEITFHKDGSGEYQLAIDMGGFMSMAKEMGKQNDSLKKQSKPEIKDSLFKLADMIKKDSQEWKRLTPEEKELFEAMKDVSIKIHINEPEAEMEMAYIYPFKKTKDLKNILKKFKEIEKIRNNKVEDDLIKDMPDTEVDYLFNKHRFRRMVKVIKPVKKDTATKQDEMLNMLNYKLVYHFPYPIQSVSYQDALLSADRKTLIIEVPVSEITRHPEILDFEVKFD